MRSAPINYLVALGLAGVLWIVFSFVVGNYLADSVSLLQLTIEEFVGTYRLVITAAAAAGVLLTCIWFFLGGKPEAARDMAKGSRLWTTLLLTAFAAAVLATIALVFVFGEEEFALVQYSIFFVATSALTWVLFWLASLMATPRAWENTMPPRK
ncbi:MAG: hypothetical protein AAFN13_05665 [Bacteroidota bacterium]